MNNRNLLIGGAIGLIILVGVGAFMLLSSKKEAPVQVDQTPIEEKIISIKPEEIGLVLSMSRDNRKVILEVNNTQGISGLDYELSYLSKGGIPRGAIGHVDIKQEGKAVRQEITLGTCSDVCHYDEDVSDIKLVLKVTKTDGSTAQVEQSL